MKLGAHLSIAGGHTNSLRKIIEIGGNCVQIFSASPRSWNFASFSEDQIKEFTELKVELQINRIYFHASYLINLADTGRIAQLSKNLLVHELKIAAQLGVTGSIIHLGSYKDTNKDSSFNKNDSLYDLFINNIKEILQRTPSDTYFIIENAGNRKIGLRLEEISEIVKEINSPRIKVCLDTCHLHAAGYDITSPDKLGVFLHTFDSLIGLNKLELIHLNDSKDELGSYRDRHENIGQGNIGIHTFRQILNHPTIKNIPFIIEVPGYDDKGPDKKNIDIVKQMLE